MNATSLADFVTESGREMPRSSLLWQTIRDIGSELHTNLKMGRIGARRFVYDRKAEDVVHRLCEIPIEDFIGQHKHILMPFDSFWIETAPLPIEEQLPGTRQRKGFLLKKAGEDINVRFVLEYFIQNDGEFLQYWNSREAGKFSDTRKLMEACGFFVSEDGRYLFPEDHSIVFSEKGISVAAESNIPNIARFYENYSFTGAERQELQEAHIKSAEHIYRMLVLVSSRNVQTTYTPATSGAGISEPPSDLLHPIRIDLAANLEQALRQRNNKLVKDLLGWTDVMRHRRTYHTLEGPVVKIIEPYERRIPHPVDRRGVTRIFTSSDPGLTVDFGPKRLKSERRKRNTSEPPMK